MTTTEMPESNGPHERSRVLFLTKYGPKAASTRHRHLQYFPFLENAGLSCAASELLSDRYLTRRFDEGRIDRHEVVGGYLRRVGQLRGLGDYDLAVVYLESLPYVPATLERLLGRQEVPYAYDIDDAVFHRYDLSPNRLVRAMLGKKIPSVIERASVVLAGNEYLAQFARRFNARVALVPTVVDTSVHVPAAEVRARDDIVIGWMGSPSTSRYVQQLDMVWRDMTASRGCRLRLVGAGAVDLPGSRVELRSWAESREVAELQDFDIGIMPLTDDPWSRGKCGFKLIQYMSCGLPVVASPVGVNARIVRDGETGFLCRTPAEWVERLKTLAADPDLRRRMGEAGRRAACAEWSLQRWAPEVVRLLGRAARVSGEDR